MGKRLGGFLPPPRLIPEIDSNCPGGREKGQGCVKELRNRIKSKFSGGVRIESAETSHRRRARRSHLPNFWSCRPSRQLEFSVARSQWQSETTDPEGQPAGNSEEPPKHPGTTVDFKPTTSRGIRNVADTLRLPNVSNPPPSGFIPR